MALMQTQAGSASAGVINGRVKRVMGRSITLIGALMGVLMGGCATVSVQSLDASGPIPATLFEATQVPTKDASMPVPTSLMDATAGGVQHSDKVSNDSFWVDLRIISWTEAWDASLKGHLLGDVHGPGSKPRGSLPCASPVWTRHPKAILDSLHPRHGRIILYGAADEFDLVMEAAERLKALGYTRVELVEQGYEAWEESIGRSLQSTVYCFSSAG